MFWPQPGASQRFPFQPSPNESVISRTHTVPSSWVQIDSDDHGAPPDSCRLSQFRQLQVNVHPTSFGQSPPL